MWRVWRTKELKRRYFVIVSVGSRLLPCEQLCFSGPDGWREGLSHIGRHEVGRGEGSGTSRSRVGAAGTRTCTMSRGAVPPWPTPCSRPCVRVPLASPSQCNGAAMCTPGERTCSTTRRRFTQQCGRPDRKKQCTSGVERSETKAPSGGFPKGTCKKDVRQPPSTASLSLSLSLSCLSRCI
jgi:hypothetical protein